ncbi:thiosulfate dehydrogenase [quinone] large subunit [Parapedobacter composti]|uniref:Thiosulfate dehydrogenase [quinone] large subunit n=2 Tax=Parapedobacter composti TaxID=623281 RepID=A0A1I1KM85_9SPHI|nr:thiosulfate dehydrogenase [quinone] large subunit [Parapedobacter composti]
MNNQRVIALFIRMPIAMSFLGHGLVRLPKLHAFASGMAEQFAGTVLPQGFVLAFGYLLVFAELITGIWLLSGRWFTQALVTALGIMTALIFGSSLIENWNAISAQLVHSLYLAGLLLLRHPIGKTVRSSAP